MQVKLLLTGSTKVNGKNITTLDYTNFPVEDKLLDFSSQENFEKSIMGYYNNYEFDFEWLPLDDYSPLPDEKWSEYVENWVEVSVTVLTKI